MIYPHFTFNQIFPLIISAILIALSVFVFHKDKKSSALVLLLFGSLGLGFFMANLDPFLHLWDEQYHALVAKNMLDNPFKPMLYATPVLEYEYWIWSSNHIWLHKQPLFLWQIALSLKLFGINEMAVRIPGIIMHAIMVFFIYRMGKISYNSNVGFYGALFFTMAFYPLELVAGKFATDHNDIAFLFYITASFWAWFEYQNSKNWKWIILIGLFSGMAVLVKWLVGLLIYSVWFISIGVHDKNNWLRYKSYLPLVYSFVITLLVFLPWQIFILSAYPLEAQHEFEYNTRHFFEVIEKHGGDIWFHFNKAFKVIYGNAFVLPLLFISGLIVLTKKAVDKVFSIAIISGIVITYIFYSLAATKMITFTIIVAPFAFLAFGAFVDVLFAYLILMFNKYKFLFYFKSIALLVICFFLLNLTKIQLLHTDSKPFENHHRSYDVKQMEFIHQLKETTGVEQYVVFNADIRYRGEIATMFYSNHIAYDSIPSQQQIDTVKMQSFKIAIYDNQKLPDYILNDEDILKIGSLSTD
jgi:4-amino-4-deoxy-L-arabinose transferase-like glycosyltransferase